MRFVIWGAGVRGRRLMHFIGKNRIVAFIDNRIEVQNTFYDDVKIISFEEYLKSYTDCFIVITPIRGGERIINELEEVNIYRFFKLSDCPNNFYDYKYEELINETHRRLTKCDVVLYGINLYSILLADYLNELGKKVTLVPRVRDENVDLHRELMADGYMIDCLENVKKITSIISTTIEVNEDECEIIRGNGLHCQKLCDFKNIIPNGINPKLTKFKDKHKGQRCFVVATGPSLKMADLDKLAEAGELCISMNGIYHAFDKTKWRPNYFVISDKIAHMLSGPIDSMDVAYKFVSDQSEEYWSEKHPENVYKFHTMFCEREMKFSEDFSVGTYTAGNVAYSCIQLAYYLGCNPIYLLGTDCNFSGYNQGDNAHFIKNYIFDDLLRNGKETPITYIYTENEQYRSQIRTYEAAKMFAEKNNLQIINATRGGKLNLFTRVDFDSLF